MILAAVLGFNEANAAMSKKANQGLSDATALQHADPEGGAFIASPVAQAILHKILSRSEYKDQLIERFPSWKAEQAMAVAGHGGGDLKAATEALALQRDTLQGKIRTQAGEDPYAVAVTDLYTKQKYDVDTAAREAKGHADEKAAWDAKLQRTGAHDDIAQIYSKTMYDADKATAKAQGVAEEKARWEAKLQRDGAGDDITQIYSKTKYDREEQSKTVATNKNAAYAQGLDQMDALIGTAKAAGHVNIDGETTLKGKTNSIRVAIAAIY